MKELFKVIFGLIALAIGGLISFIAWAVHTTISIAVYITAILLGLWLAYWFISLFGFYEYIMPPWEGRF